MKRIIYFLLAFCAIPVLHSCSDDETDTVLAITVSDIERNSAVINVVIPEEERQDISECGIYCSETEDPTAADKVVIAERNENGNFHIKLTELKGGTTYYVKGFALNKSTTMIGETVSFTTLSGVPELRILRILLSDEFDIIINDLGGGKIKEVGYCYVVDNGNISDNFMPSIDNSKREVYSKPINQDITRFKIPYIGGSSGLSNIQYYGRVYVITDNGIGYSQRVHYASHLR